ncbi:UDP-glucuronosyl/UDP-glucosyltransferase [Corchorus olitorius]|uniref:UDP-glucuronosyl/UDP-glucosyltransferase n=1 Tax=Corchorus olitorius TaxID=93759 RepID=A0A1R3G0R3_9ROSI|nr:UDP-glucuronosyl/UDP-glucosyltransferase [Corchorus olitorius]
MGRQPHVLVMPFPALGHVAPLMKLSFQIAAHGVKVTFVNTEVMHEKIMVSLPEKFEEQSWVSLVSIPDGVDGDAKTDIVKYLEAMRRAIPGYFEDLIENINRSNVDEN